MMPLPPKKPYAPGTKRMLPPSKPKQAATNPGGFMPPQPIQGAVVMAAKKAMPDKPEYKGDRKDTPAQARKEAQKPPTRGKKK